METAVSTMERQFPAESRSESPAETGNIVLQNQREMLLKKIQYIQIYNSETNRQGYFGTLVDKTRHLFIELCKSKFGLSIEQLKKLNREELDELAAIIYEQSKKWYFVQAIICALIPVFGWGILIRNNFPDIVNVLCCATNMRYCVWYEKVRKLSGKNFSPTIG